MKALAFLLNISGMLISFYLYRSLGAMVFLFIGLVPALTLIILSGLSDSKFILLMMILNLCLACGGVIQFAVLLFSGLDSGYIFSMQTTFMFLSIFIAMAILNLVNLKNIRTQAIKN